MPGPEKAINDEINQALIKKPGRAWTDNGDAVSTVLPHTKLNLRNGKVVRMISPGSRKDYTPVKNGEDLGFKMEIQNPQRVPIHEACVKKAEIFRKCVNETLGLNPRFNFIYRSQAMQAAVCEGMRRSGDTGPCGEEAAGHGAGCGMDVSSADAVRSPNDPDKATQEANLKGIPYKVENGRPFFIGDIKDPAEREAMRLKYVDGLVGLHDLAMECGLKAGYFGGFCSYGRDPWHYEDMEHLLPNDPRRQCIRGSELFNNEYEALRTNPRRVTMESLFNDFSWTKAARLTTESITEGIVDVINIFIPKKK